MTMTNQTIQNSNHSYNIDQLQYQKHLFFQNKSTIASLYPYEGSKSDSIDDFTKREMLLSNTLDKIAPKYEEIENLLSHIPEPKKTQILGGIISKAIIADNPIAFINNQIKDLRKAKFYNKMLDDASAFLGFDKQLTMEYLKMGLKEDTMD